MEIYRLYEVVRMWEIALTLTKPEDIIRIRISPMIGDNIQGTGEGDIYGYLKVFVEAEGKYAELIYGYDVTHYSDASEKKWVEEEQVSLLIEFMEDRMNSDYINSFWENFLQDVEWKPLPFISSPL